MSGPAAAEARAQEPGEPPVGDLPSWIGAVKAVGRAAGHVEAAALSLFLVALISVGCFQAIARNFFSYNPDWVDPIIRASVYVIGLTGAALAAQADRLINIDILSRFLPARARLAVRVVTSVFAVYICSVLVRSGWLHHKSYAGEQGHGLLSDERVSLVLPVAATLIAIHLALQALVDLYFLASGRTPPASEAEVPRL